MQSTASQSLRRSYLLQGRVILRNLMLSRWSLIRWQWYGSKGREDFWSYSDYVLLVRIRNPEMLSRPFSHPWANTAGKQRGLRCETVSEIISVFRILGWRSQWFERKYDDPYTPNPPCLGVSGYKERQTLLSKRWLQYHEFLQNNLNSRTFTKILASFQRLW